MSCVDAESENDVFNGDDELASYKRVLEKMVTEKSAELEKAMEALPVSAPTVTNALQAILSSASGMAAESMREVFSFHEDEQRLIRDRMKIDDAEEELQR